MDVVKAIGKVETFQDRPIEDVKITKITILTADEAKESK